MEEVLCRAERKQIELSLIEGLPLLDDKELAQILVGWLPEQWDALKRDVGT